MGDLGQSLPPDTGAKLAQLELGAEQCVAGLGEQEQEHKRARTVRYEFQVRGRKHNRSELVIRNYNIIDFNGSKVMGILQWGVVSRAGVCHQPSYPFKL